MKSTRLSIRTLTLLISMTLSSLSFADGHLDPAHAALANSDFSNAATLFTKAADAGDAEAQYQLGLLFASGKGVEADLAKAQALMYQAAAQGHPGATTWLANNEEEEADPEDDC